MHVQIVVNVFTTCFIEGTFFFTLYSTKDLVTQHDAAFLSALIYPPCISLKLLWFENV
jgi:hypothetical protein